MSKLKSMAKYIIEISNENLHPKEGVPFHNKYLSGQEGVTQELGSKHVTVGYSGFEPGGGIDMHTHESFDQIYIAAEGRIEVILNEEKYEVDSPAFIFIPAGVKHGIKVLGNEIHTHYVISAPPSRSYP